MKKNLEMQEVVEEIKDMLTEAVSPIDTVVEISDNIISICLSLFSFNKEFIPFKELAKSPTLSFFKTKKQFPLHQFRGHQILT